MREIKFRAWLKKDKKMVEVFSISLDDWIIIHEMSNPKEPVGMYQRQPSKIEPEYLMQYTGLKDKNGTEIYESDRLRVDEYYTHPDGRVIKSGEYEVRYMLGSFGILRHEGWWDLSDFTVELIPNEGVIPNVKVIGNIYENPELIASDNGQFTK